MRESIQSTPWVSLKPRKVEKETNQCASKHQDFMFLMLTSPKTKQACEPIAQGATKQAYYCIYGGFLRKEIKKPLPKEEIRSKHD
jgi:hypothetical protein